jgi:hypothetical protein
LCSTGEAKNKKTVRAQRAKGKRAAGVDLVASFASMMDGVTNHWSHQKPQNLILSLFNNTLPLILQIATP